MRRKGVMSLLGIALIVCMMNLVAFAASSPLSASQEKSFVLLFQKVVGQVLL